MNNLYRMELLVRRDDKFGFLEGCLDSSEHPFKANITAPNKIAARRAAMEVVWRNGLLVSRFVQIRVGGVPG